MRTWEKTINNMTQLDLV